MTSLEPLTREQAQQLIDAVNSIPMNPVEDQGPFLSVAQVAKKLGVSVQYVRDTFKPSFTIGQLKERRYSEPMIDAWLAERINESKRESVS